MSNRPRTSLRPVSSSHPAASGASGVPKPYQRPAQLFPTPAAGADFVPTPCVQVPGDTASQVVIDPIYTKLVVVHGQAPGSDGGVMKSKLTGVMVVLPGVGREPRVAGTRRVCGTSGTSGTAVTDPAAALIESMPTDSTAQDGGDAASPPDYAAKTSGRTKALRPDFDGEGLRVVAPAGDGVSAEYAGKEEVEVKNDTLGMIFVRTSPSNGMTWAINSRRSLVFSHGHTGWSAERR